MQLLCSLSDSSRRPTVNRRWWTARTLLTCCWPHCRLINARATAVTEAQKPLSFIECASSRATRAPDSHVSVTTHKHSRVKSSTTTRIPPSRYRVSVTISMFAANLRDLHPRFLLAHKPDDLFFVEPASLHSSAPLRVADSTQTWGAFLAHVTQPSRSAAHFTLTTRHESTRLRSAKME